MYRETIELAVRNDKSAARARPVLSHSALREAIWLARAVSDEALSLEILRTVAETSEAFRQTK
jgi:hypothetical protein